MRSKVGAGVTAIITGFILATSACSVEEASSTNPSPVVAQPTPAPSKETKPSTPVSNPTGTGEKVEQKIDNSTGGEITTSDGTKIEVPPGALPPGVEAITIESSTVPAPTEYTTVSPVFVFGPEGTVFLKPLKISIPFELPAGNDVSKLTVLWSRFEGPGFDMVPSQFVPVEGSTTKYIAVGEVTHFSQGMCGEKFETDPNPAPDPYSK